MAPNQSQTPTLIPASIADRLRELEAFSRFRVEGFLHALNKSPYKGSSSDFLQHRQYFPGDNLKFLNWRVYAKSERLYVKEFEEETNTRISILLDVSNSMAHKGDALFSKLDFGVRCAASIVYLANLQRDSFSVSTFNTNRAAHLPFGSGQSQFQRALTLLADLKPEGGTNFTRALTESTAPLRHRGLTVVISDFMDDPERIIPLIARLRFKGSDVIAMQIFDPSERAMEYNTVVRFHDFESAEVITVDPTLIQREYQREFDLHQEAMKGACLKSGFDHLLLPVADDFETPLAAYLRRRMMLAA